MSTSQEEINDALIIAYLNGEDLPDKQREHITQWLQEPANKSKAQESYRVWELSMLAEGAHDDIDAQWKKMSKTIDGNLKQEKQSNKKWWRSAAAILLISALSYMAYFQFLVQSTTVLKAEKTKQEYILPDKTKVTLARSAELSYSGNQLSDHSRQRIITLKGNAYFNVNPDKEKPFIITRTDAEIKVLGTKFYVFSNETGSTMVSVIEGAVSVKYFNSNKSFILHANEKIEPNQDEVGKLELNNFFWNTRTLSFQNDSLTNVFNELSKNYDVRFELKNKKIGSCLLTSKFENLDLKEILEVLSSIYPLEFEEEVGNKLNVKGDGCH